jgi:hypothetical protein
MKCPRCGKDNPPSVHTCTAPPAIYLAEQIEAVYEAPHLPRKAAAELRRLYEENVRLEQALKMAHLEYAGCMEDLREAESDGDKLSPTEPKRTSQDYFFDRPCKTGSQCTNKCQRCSVIDWEAEAGKQAMLCEEYKGLLRQALYLIEAWERGAESADYWREIAALRERLK